MGVGESSIDSGVEDSIKSLLKLMGSYAAVMTVAALAIGVLYREVSKAYLASVPLSDAITASYYLSVAHGHTFMVGVLIPAALATLTYVAVKLGGELSPKSARRAFAVYVIGSLMMLALLVYKGLGIVVTYGSNPAAGLDAANNALFLGSHALRESLYGVAHLLLGIGLVWYVTLLIKAFRRA